MLRIRHAAPAGSGLQSSMMRLAVLIGVSLSWGCATTPAQAPTPERAAALAARGDHSAAALEYDAVAAVAVGVIGNDYRLLAAREWLAAGRAREAEAALGRLAPPLEAAQGLARDLFAAEAALLAGDAPRAWNQLGAITPAAAETEFDRYHALRQRAALGTDQPLEAVRSERAREARAPDAARRAALREELLDQLRRASTAGAAFDPRTAGRDAVARGWLEAAPLAARAATAPASANAAIIAAWKKRYPDHPAGAALAATNAASVAAVPGVAAAGTSGSAAAGTAAASAAGASGTTAGAGALASGSHIAALLPLSGRNAAAGAQLRDGLLAAWYAQPAEGRLPLRFYDTGAATADGAPAVAAQLAAAQTAGAAFVIGPLIREDVVAAAAALATAVGPAAGARRPGPPVGLLALNFLNAGTGPTPAALHQFGLSPEDESRAVARRALSAGERRAVALVPQGDWGERVLRAFREEYEAGGGTLLATRPLQGREYGPAIRAALGIDASRARHQRLQSLLGSALTFQPRRRGDVDVLFLPGQPAHVRQLRAQLKFESAGDIPFYTTSDAWDGRADADLEGLSFPDMPWMITPNDSRVAAARAQAESAWGDLRGRGRLFALGHDAWLVQEALRAGRLAAGRGEVEGLTGTLALDDERRVRRALRWAEVRSGVLRPLDDSP